MHAAHVRRRPQKSAEVRSCLLKFSQFRTSAYKSASVRTSPHQSAPVRTSPHQSAPVRTSPIKSAVIPPEFVLLRASISHAFPTESQPKIIHDAFRKSGLRHAGTPCPDVQHSIASFHPLRPKSRALGTQTFRVAGVWILSTRTIGAL